VTDSGEAERKTTAMRLEWYARLVALVNLPIAAIAIVDLLTGSLVGVRRIDVALLLSVPMGIAGACLLTGLPAGFGGTKSASAPQSASMGYRHRYLGRFYRIRSVVGYLIGGRTLAVVGLLGSSSSWPSRSVSA
jgi:hypothetical protein